MDNLVKITLPKLGESIVNATVLQWFKKVGDRIALDEPLLEVATDKVNSEIPSPVSGILKEIFAQPEEEVQVGGLLASIATETGSSSPQVPAQPVCSAAAPKEEFISPAVLRLLSEKGIPLSDIEKIPHTGQGGRVTKKDVEEYASFGSKEKSSPSSDSQRVPMTPMRKAIADNMVKSFYQAPHASLITEVDATDLLRFIQQEKEPFFARTGVKLTITPFAARAIARALQEFPLLNSSLDGDTIIVKRFVNLGIAVSVDQGVMVPVIKECEKKTLSEIGKEIAHLAQKTRSHSLSPQDIQEGTITMTNFGMTGTLIGIPIIRYPEVAILGLGAVTKKVAAMPDDSIAIRSVLSVSLTFDHRVLDGIYGCGFINQFKQRLEKDIFWE